MDAHRTTDLILAVAVVVLGAAGTYLLLPHRHGCGQAEERPRRGRRRWPRLALLLFATFWRPPGPWLSGLFFYAFALAAVAGAVLTITSRNPVYSALWFAAVVLSTSGLFLLAGAQFLAAGTVIVYAGAIIVTFLFVIMLAQMEGRALYDRAARAPFSATFSCFLLFWALLYSLFLISRPRADAGRARVAVGGRSRPPYDPRLLADRAPRRRRRRPASEPATVEVARAVRATTARLADRRRPAEAARRRARRDALHRPPDHRRAGRRPAVRRPDRGPGDRDPEAAGPARRPRATSPAARRIA